MALHPQAQTFLDMAAEAGGPPLSEMTVEQARGLPPLLGQLVGEGPQIAAVRDIEIPGPAGAIPARVYEPTDSPAGTVVYIHGGGWVVGGLDDWDAVLRMLARDSGARVVSVDYRLAPEHPYPAAVHDVDAAVQWVASHLADGAPIVVAGDSAGGNLTAVASLHARDGGGPHIALQVLIYPVVDADTSTANYDAFRDTHLFLNTPDMEWFWNHYLGDGDKADPDVSPLRAQSLAGLPPAYVIVAGYDPLTEDALKYAKRLEDEGVKVTVRRYDDQMHAFVSMANFIDTANQAIADIGAAIRAALS